MKKIFLLLTAIFILGLTSLNAQTCLAEKGYNDFPFTANGITVDKSLTGNFATYGSPYSACGINEKAFSIWTGQSGPATFKTTFSLALNDIMYNLAGSNTTEAFTVTVSNGTPTITIVECSCPAAWTISGNLLTCSNDGAASGNAGARIKIHSTEPYTWIDFAHNGGAGGTIFTMCFDAAYESVNPTVTTTAITSITGNSASSGGDVTADGGAAVTARGVCWNTSGTPTIANSFTSDGSGIGTFSSSITSLSPGTTYYVRAYATNANGTAYGSQLSFATASTPVTANPTSISASVNPICNGSNTQLTANGAEGTVYWYTSSCGGTFVTTGNPITVSPSASTTYYARNYNNSQYSAGCATVLVTVSPSLLLPVAGSNSYMYDGTGKTASATVGAGETVDWYAAAIGGTVISAPSGTNVGIYSAYAEARNTTTGCVSATRKLISLEITAKSIVITADAGQTKVFGDSDPALYTYTFAPALVGVDVINGSMSRVSGGNVGNYAYTIGTLTAGSNYSLSVALTPEFSITSKAIVITADAGQTKVFGDSDPAPYTYTYAPALVGADVINGLMGRISGENVGTYAYTIGTLTAGMNYSLSVALTPEFSITSKAIVITADAGQTKVFGNSDPTPYTYTFAPALVGTDLFAGSLSRVNGENVGTYAYTIGTLTAGMNYSLSLALTPEFSITSKAIVITADAGQTKVFGDSDPALYAYTFAPALVGTDVINGSMGRVSGENVGTYAYTIGTLAAGMNYSLSIALSPEFSIISKSIVITADAGQTKVFGDSDPALYAYTFAPALVGTDVITGLMGRVGGENVGNYAYTIGTLTAGMNYSLSVALTPEFGITSKAIVITADAGQTKVFGDSDPALYAYTFAPALVGTDVINGLMGRVSGENIGTYAYTIGTLTAGMNYSLSVALTPEFSITPHVIVVTADAGQTKVFGDSDPTLFTYTFSPALVGTDVFTGSLSRVSGENVGTYVYTIGTLTAGSNYSLSVAAVPEFSITAKAIVVTADAGQTKVYGEADPVPFIYAFTPSLQVNDAFTGSISRISGENTGSYAYTLGTLDAGSNYSVSISAATEFSITQKDLAVQAEDKGKCFDGAIYSGGYTVAYSGFVNGEGSDVLGGMLTYSGTAIAAIQAGTYSIIPSGLTSLNYLISYSNGNLGIGIAPVPSITGSNSLCAGTTGVQYATEPGSSNYIWTISFGGTFTSGLNTNQITVDWGIAGTRSISVNYVNENGCYSYIPATHTIEVLSVPVPIINGLNSVCQGSSGVDYFTQVNYDDYLWTVSPGGTITSGVGTNAITVSWTGTGDQTVSAEYTNDLGCASISPTLFDVFVTSLPATPVITQHGDTLTSSYINGNQWYLNGVLIPGATDPQHIAVYTGNYTVVVTLADCSSGVSNSILVLPVSVSDVEVSQAVEVYPNPNQGQFNIKITSAEIVDMNIEIINITGVLVWKQENVTIHGTQILPVNIGIVPDGVYMVTLRNLKTNMMRKVIIRK